MAMPTTANHKAIDFKASPAGDPNQRLLLPGAQLQGSSGHGLQHQNKHLKEHTPNEHTPNEHTLNTHTPNELNITLNKIKNNESPEAPTLN